MLQRTSLLSWEYGTVEQGRHHLDLALWGLLAPGIGEVLAHENDTATGTAERLVGGRGNDVCPLHGVFKQTCCNETGRVGHVNHEQGTHFIGNLAHALVVPFAAVGRTTADDELGLVLLGQTLHLIVIYSSRLAVQVVAYGLVENAAGIYQGTV